MWEIEISHGKSKSPGVVEEPFSSLKFFSKIIRSRDPSSPCCWCTGWRGDPPPGISSLGPIGRSSLYYCTYCTTVQTAYKVTGYKIRARGAGINALPRLSAAFAKKSSQTLARRRRNRLAAAEIPVPPNGAGSLNLRRRVFYIIRLFSLCRLIARPTSIVQIIDKRTKWSFFSPLQNVLW